MSSSAALEVGVAVEADYKGRGKFFAGKISRVRLNGTYDVDYDDGEKELGVSKELIRVYPAAAPRNRREDGELDVGTFVEANFKAKGNWYFGKIVRARLNGTYDIDYDDGESELGVAREHIKVKTG
jgi:hypothetical protein